MKGPTNKSCLYKEINMTKITTGTLQDFLDGSGIGFDRVWDIV